MGRISEVSRRHRTKEVLCGDLASVLNANLHYGTEFAVLDNAMWVWSEFDGKFDGCRQWSLAASQHRQHHGKVITSELTHDHVVPKKVLMELLQKLPRPTTAAAVRQLFEAYCFGAVLTRAEDGALNRMGLRSSMPKGWDGTDPWARYAAAGIVLVKQPCTTEKASSC